MKVTDLEREKYFTTIANNEMHASSFLKKVNLVYLAVMFAWFSFSMYAGTISFDTTFKMEIQYLIISIIMIALLVYGGPALGWGLLLVIPTIFISLNRFSESVETGLNVNIDYTVLLYSEYVSIALLVINSVYTFIVFNKTKLKFKLPFLKIYLFIIPLMVMIGLNILKTYYVIEFITEISFSVWAFLQVSGILLVSLGNLFIRYLAVFHDELELIKNVLRLRWFVSILVFVSVFLIAFFYVNKSVYYDIETYSMVFGVITSVISVTVVSYLFKFFEDTMLLLPLNKERNIVSYGINYVAGTLFLYVGMALFLSVLTPQTFLPSLLVLIVFTLVVLILRNIYSAKMMLAFLFVTLLPIISSTIEDFSHIHGFWDFLEFIFEIVVAVPLYFLFVIVVGGIVARPISKFLYNYQTGHVMFILIGSISLALIGPELQKWKIADGDMFKITHSRNGAHGVDSKVADKFKKKIYLNNLSLFDVDSIDSQVAEKFNEDLKSQNYNYLVRSKNLKIYNEITDETKASILNSPYRSNPDLIYIKDLSEEEQFKQIDHTSSNI
ncbi:hypothetical protein SMGD1_2009 [Sulfurimonas gotlandica GD1]|uniref:Uncharacterized protein n=1 Tax=Sulfurimonas gotlandica (strain DSM 19862 / JCM 16533 / GD1) TaxID=929558 RepID=B6BJ17_SULGG|nr:hypothetical protein [Sulfurimonas gotlandica]EDZ63126.1 hypothetical protein CBGD1_745 [Sulfurimonas gotlandica GD1]EHP30532.1 hypothetical protein SMGD1_2009 [Sulfurimonas gotlandica GD1]